MRRLFAAALALIALAVALAAARPALAQDAHEPFAVGQVWTLSGSAYPQARVLIGGIEDDVIHIRISGLQAPERPNYLSKPFAINHAAITAAALDVSVSALTDSDAPLPPSFQAGYEAWRKAEREVFEVAAPDIIASQRDALSPED